MNLRLLSLAIILLSTPDIFGQTASGIYSKKLLIGFQHKIWYGGINGNSNQFFIEKIVSNHANIGLSYSRYNSYNDFSSDNNLFSANKISYNNNKKKYFVFTDKLKYGYFLKVNTIEFNIKKFRLKNEIHNFGWYYNFKIGMNLATTLLPQNTEIGLGSNPNVYDFSIETTSISKYLSYRPLVGFEIGESIPFLFDKFILSGSVAVNLNFTKSLRDGEITFEDYIKIHSSRYLFSNQLFSLNIGISHVL